MKPQTKAFLISFIITGGIYGIIMMGFDLLQGDNFNIWKYVFQAVFFGFLMALTHRYSEKKRLQKEKEKAKN